MKEKIRTFIAIDLPDDIRQQLHDLQTDLRQSVTKTDRIRWVEPKSTHLTLKFLGEISPSQVDDVIIATKQACESVTPFQLSLQDLGGFPNLDRPRVLWVGISGDVEQIRSLAKSIEIEMRNVGFPKEKRPFRPHLTISRIKSLKGIQPLILAVKNKLFSCEPFEVREIFVMKSQLHPQGAIYTPLDRISL